MDHCSRCSVGWLVGWLVGMAMLWTVVIWVLWVGQV